MSSGKAHGSICFVRHGAGADEAERLTAAGWRVHVLDCARIDAAVRPPHADTFTAGVNDLLRLSDRVRHALVELHRRERFDLIEFPAWQGLGFRSIQARRAGVCLRDVRLLVRLDDLSQRRREETRQWLDGVEALRTDYAERYAFEQADEQILPCPALADYARSIGWQLRADAVELSAVDRYQGLRRTEAPTPIRTDPPRVGVVVSHYNLGAYLPEALGSLAVQTYPALHVVVVDDGSTCPDSRRVLEEQERLYPHFRFVRQSNAGCGAARNRGLNEVGGPYVIFFDADNVALPHMVETFVTAMERRPEVSALSCYVRAFRDGVAPRRFEWVNTFVGGPHVLSCLENVYGDTNAILRVADLRAVGGYENDRSSAWEDWMTYVKLVRAGHALDVVPEYLFDYRLRASGRISAMTATADDTFAHTLGLLRHSFQGPAPSRADMAALWTVLVSFRQRQGAAAEESARLLPRLRRGMKRLLRFGLGTLERLRRRAA